MPIAFNLILFQFTEDGIGKSYEQLSLSLTLVLGLYKKIQKNSLILIVGT